MIQLKAKELRLIGTHDTDWVFQDIKCRELKIFLKIEKNILRYCTFDYKNNSTTKWIHHDSYEEAFQYLNEYNQMLLDNFIRDKCEITFE